MPNSPYSNPVRVPRCFTSASLKAVSHHELHTFCDAFNEVIDAVSYLRTIHCYREIQVAFVLGKAKLAPSHATTVPHLELCAAVLAVEIAELITKEMHLEFETTLFHSDSQVVLGYISNESRRFYVYVSNRVERIRRSSTSKQGHYVPTLQNPADLAMRSVHAQNLIDIMWHSTPKFLYSQDSLVSIAVSREALEVAEYDP